MKKKWLKKGSAVLLTAAMVLSLFPGMKGTLATVKAAENTAPTSGYWTDAEGLKGYSLSSTSAIGKIKFGLNGSDSRLWAICGADGDNLALLSTSEFAQATYGSTSEYSKSNFVTNIDTYLGATYFSTGETGKMADVTVLTNEPDTSSGGNHPMSVTDKKLYLPNSLNQSSYGQSTIYVGSSNNIAIDVTKLNSANGFQTNLFWLRSPRGSNSYYALVAVPGIIVDDDDVLISLSVVPAFNLNLSSDILASAAAAASSSYSGYKANNDMTENTYTLRYTYTTGEDSAVINSSGTQVEVTNAMNKYLMVQNSTGVYALAIDSASKTVNASDITMENPLENFNNCKVWIESTDADRITTAKMATQAITINSVELTDITAPAAGSALDTEAACATEGVSSQTLAVTWKQGEEAATGNAGYNTTYTASVTLTADDDYEFASSVTATVNGTTASATKNGNGTVTVTYRFSKTAKAKLTSITTPTISPVENGTAYADMGLPTNVAIVTEGNTETTAAVAWNTATPNSGSYDPRLQTEQTVTLNGAVTCPSNIDQNNVTLSTTITVTISAAGIVGTPTFAPVAGTYTENQSVALTSSTDGATIYYTTDGSTPTTTGSDVYSGAISVTGTAGESISTTIKAIAVKEGMQTSSMASATYVIELPAPSTYAVTVNHGTGDESYAAGAIVTITADAAPSGQIFDKWTVVSGGATLASETSATTTFEMPANAVEVTATYKNKPSDPTPPAPNPPTPTYVGTPTFAPVAGTYTENQLVALISSTDGATIYYTTDGSTPTTGSDVYSGAISVTGTAGESISTTIKAIAVKDGMQTSSMASATYVIELPAPSTYAVTVNHGTGDESYAAGAIVTITADAAPSGQIFDKWTVVSGGATLASETSATTTFEMPANAVEVTATYKNKPSDPTPPAPNPPTPTYTITAGAGGTHKLSTDGTLMITCDVALDKLTGIYVDDKLVDAANYTLKSGSTILTFKAAYLNTLSVGTHKVRFQYNDGSAETTFVIKEADTENTTTQETTTSSEKDEVPKTGDSTPIAWLFILAVISGVGVVYFGRKKKTVR